MNDKAGLGPEIPLGEGLRAIAREALAEGRRALEDPARSDAAAVHDFRKAMKRWRALLRLLAPDLADAETLRKEARDLARELTGPRDRQAASEALDDIARHDEAFGLTSRSLQTMRRRLEAAREHAETATLTPIRRERLCASLTLAADAIEGWPIEELTFRDIAASLSATYRRARRLIPDDWMQANPEHLHALRKRVVEHRYQMEMIEPLWPRVGRAWTDEAQRLRERLGRCQDLEVLRRTTAAHQPLAPWRSRLAPLIAARRATQVASASRLAARLFAEQPKAFRRRLVALWEISAEHAAGTSAAGPPADLQDVPVPPGARSAGTRTR
jgi:CHAD domain-containing protein